jgi:hypothetical protein
MRITATLPIVATLFLAATNAAAAMTAVATATTLNASGFERGTRVAVVRYGVTTLNGYDAMVDEAVVETAGSDGTVRVESKIAAPSAVWLVVDLTTNDYLAVSTPRARPQYARTQPVVEANGARFAVSRNYALAAVVRPHLGIWSGFALDGAAPDDDHAHNGAVSFAASNLKPVASTPPAPAVLVPGDTIFVFDPQMNDFSVFRIPAGGTNAH